jgi:hypothetical protein
VTGQPSLDALEPDDPLASGLDGNAPSEVAHLIANLIPALPERTLADLRRLLQRRLTAFDNLDVRYARLGLLIDIVSTGTGEVPTTRAYEGERERRASCGETWPVHSTLSVAYGGWVRAVRAAMLLWRDGSSSRTANSNHHFGDRPPYTHEEAVRAMLVCRDTLGVWPTEGEYDDWRRLARELARSSGRPEPRLPGRSAWVRLFGSWQAFERRARREADVAITEAQLRDASEPESGQKARP